MAMNTLLTLGKNCKHKNQERKMSTDKHITDHYNKKIRRLNEYIKISKQPQEQHMRDNNDVIKWL